MMYRFVLRDESEAKKETHLVEGKRPPRLEPVLVVNDLRGPEGCSSAVVPAFLEFFRKLFSDTEYAAPTALR